MTETEKYAKVFRAAADGLVTPAALERFRQPGVVGMAVTLAECIERPHPWTMNAPHREQAIQYLAYDGVARMFEKIVEAEKSIPPPATAGEGTP